MLIRISSPQIGELPSRRRLKLGPSNCINGLGCLDRSNMPAVIGIAWTVYGIVSGVSQQKLVTLHKRHIDSRTYLQHSYFFYSV